MKNVSVTRRNTWFQLLETLRRNRQKRTKEGKFVVDGVRAINLLMANEAWTIDAFVYPRGLNFSQWARDIMGTARARWCICVEPELFAELTDRDEPPELFVVADIPADAPERIAFDGEKPLQLAILDRTINPGNLGTIIRSCDAFGVDGAVVFGHAVDLYAPETIRASLGTIFTVPCIRMYTWQEIDTWFAAIREVHPNFQVVGSSAQMGRAPWLVDLTRPTGMVFGNETEGMSRGFAERAQDNVCIQMHGAASSLNIANAASSLLYEMSRQRAL